MKYLLPAAALASLLAAGPAAVAQPAGSLLSIWNLGGDGSGAGDWNTASNWNPASVPDVINEDSAVINGGGVATVAGVSPTAGGLVLGQNAGESGTLRVTGGSIVFAEDVTFPADGSLRVGQGGTGTLEVTGGSLTALSLSSAGEAGSLINLSGTATVNAGSASLARTTRVTGPDVQFATTNSLSLTGTHNLIADITGPSHSTIDVGATATLGGALSVEFNGYMPSISDTWNLFSASTVSGAFSAINVAGATFGAGQALNVRSVPSGGDTLVQLFLEQQLVLQVDRATGVVSITNPGSTGVVLDGYSVRSPNGSLSQGGWNPLASQVGSGWTEANPSASALNEIINGSNSTTIGGGVSFNLGGVYNPAAPTEFGAPSEDLTFQYTAPGSGNITATVSYTGAGVINDLVLYVDPSTGQATLRNASPFNVAIEAYTITSESSALDTAAWTSLDDAGVEGGAWVEANPSAARVSELMDSGITELGVHRSFDLGGLVNGGAEDLVFQYLLAGEAAPRTGVVVYEAAPAQVLLPGDYNDDGTVNAADYTVWRDALGTATTLPGDTSPGGVAAVDYTVWASNYGATAALSVAVPEPGALAGVLAGLLLASGRRRSRA